MKKAFWMGLVIAMALVLCAGAVLAEPVQGAQRRITVEGSASVKVKPDVAYVNLGVVTESTEAKRAQTENAQIMNEVLAAVKALGIADGDVQTSGFNVAPKYNYETQTTTDYSVSNSVVVTLKDIEQVSAVIDAAVAAGANNISISFAVTDPSPVYQQSLKHALADAKGKAAALAEALGMDIGLPLEVTEQSGYRPYASAKYEMAMADAGGGVPIQSGEIEVSATVQAVYEY